MCHFVLLFCWYSLDELTTTRAVILNFLVSVTLNWSMKPLHPCLNYVCALLTNEKSWQLRMHCNLRPPEATPVLFRCNYNAMPSLKSFNYSLPSYSIFAAKTLRYAVTLTFDFHDLYLWPWTFVVYHLWPGKTLYQIWVKSSNPRRSDCRSNVWPSDREHVSRVKLCRSIIFTEKLNSANLSLRETNLTIFAGDTLCHAVSWTFDPLTLNVCCTSSVVT